MDRLVAPFLFLRSPRKWPALLAIPFVLISSGAAVGQDPEGWKLVWADEFDLPDGSAPDPLNWNYNIGTGSNGWGNQELQYYTDRTKNARIEAGELIIEVHEEDFGGSSYTSARLLTRGKWDWSYGRIEARIKVPAGIGLWPAFWTLGDPVDWPTSGEIDIMEFVGREPNEIFGTIHGPGYSGGQAFGSIVQFDEPVPNNYHTYWVEWEPDRIRWYLNGMLYHTATPADVAPNEWVFNRANHFIILNVAVGGTFGGALSTRNPIDFPVRMQVDYVRVYESENGIPVTVNEVPGRIELEDYATHFGVRTEVTSDVGGGLNLGFLTDGDWAEYLLNVPQGGTYALDLRYASPNGTAGVTVTTETGVDISTGALTATGGWQNWATTAVGEIVLPSGEVTLRLTTNVPGADDINLNWIELTAVGAGTWAGYPTDANSWVNTGSFLGWIFTGNAPWVWSLSLEKWMYLPESNLEEAGAWTYVARPPQ